MEWRNPNILFSLIPVSVIWVGISIYGLYRNRQTRERLLKSGMADKLMPTVSMARFFTRLFFQLLGVVSVLVALAGPQFGEIVERTTPRGSDLYVLLDVSRSMLANDVPPTRLDRAKSDISALTNQLNGERIGLIAFAGQAVVKCPLTVDYESFRRSLLDVDTNSAPRGGTAIGDAIRKAMEVFVTTSQRHQAILLITDGDDQESYPLDAAEFAAERSVTIFAVGLGDASTGARIPSKPNSDSFVEYGGEQVWSKLDNSLLEQIATKTSGVYIPAGTQAYDLGKIYSDYLAGREGDAAESQKRVRRADQFQWFLAIGLISLLAEFWTRSFHRLPQVGSSGRGTHVAVQAMKAAVWILVSFAFGSSLNAEEVSKRIQQGLRFYSESKFQEASEVFQDAVKALDEDKDADASLATFDQACAEHRLGNRDVAIDLYLKSAMSKDRSLASKSQFNFGKLQVEALMEKAQAVPAGEESKKPEEIEKYREGIIDLAKQAITAYRHSLELDPVNEGARRNIEIVRQWLKLTTDRWREEDRQKRRDETNLLQFLDYVVGVEQMLLAESSKLKNLYALDRHAELKQIQDELLEELPTLREKIVTELSKSQEPNSQASQDPKASQVDKEVEKAIELLENWLDVARDHMRQSSRSLGQFLATESLASQRGAIEELEKIWNAVAPFQAILAKSLAEQTAIATELKPTSTDEPKDSSGETPGDEESAEIRKGLLTEQERTLARARLLAPKAESELSMLSKASSERRSDLNAERPLPNTTNEADETSNASEKQKLAETKQGLEKAIELAPQAVDAMMKGVSDLQKEKQPDAWEHAEEARKILEKIAKSQPPPPPQENQQQNQDQQQNNPNQDNRDSNNQDESKTEKDKEEQKESNKDKENKDQKEQSDKDKKPEEKPSKEEKSSNEKNSNGKKMSQDRIEEALRKVREREAEKRERDRQLKARALGRPSVEKDW